jgi:hypothetical protein
MSAVNKHLIGRHDQDDHDPRKKKRDHSRSGHAGFWSENLITPTKTGKEYDEVRRKAWHDANDRGLGAIDRQTAMAMAVRGHRKYLADKEEKRRKLSREENGFLKHHVKENTGSTAFATAVGAGLVAGFTRNPNMLREWMKFANRSQGIARTNPSLAKPWRQTFKSGRISDSLGKSIDDMLEGTFGGYTSKVTTKHLNRNVVYVAGEVTDKSGKYAGHWQRTFNRGGEVHHDLLMLSPKMQGSGFAKGFYEQSMKAYKANGFQQVTTLANIDVGGYAWARQGFQFAPGTAFTGRAEMFVRAAMARNKHSTYTSQDVVRAQLLALTPGAKPIDFTKIGASRKWTDANGIEHWFGKDMMLGSNWFASKAL